MEQRFSLEAAGKLFGVSANAMRARAKKHPEKYRTERDNGGKIWLWIDPENLPSRSREKGSVATSVFEELKVSIEALKFQAEDAMSSAELSTKLAVATAEIRQLQERILAAEADRDRWQEMAEKLADRPRRSWWPWGRS